MKNMAFKAVDRLLVAVHGPSGPSDEEWSQYLDAVRERGLERALLLIVSDGGGPSSTQRRRLNELLDGRTAPVAVLCAGAEARRITTALSWFNRATRGFAPSELREALGHLGAPEHLAAVVDMQISSLRREVTPGPSFPRLARKPRTLARPSNVRAASGS